MKLINNGTNPLAHGAYKLPKGAVAEIPDEIAKEWLKIRAIKQYVSSADLVEATQKADAKVKAVENENEKLKAELEALKAKLVKADEKAEATQKADAKDTKKSNK